MDSLPILILTTLHFSSETAAIKVGYPTPVFSDAYILVDDKVCIATFTHENDNLDWTWLYKGGVSNIHTRYIAAEDLLRNLALKNSHSLTSIMFNYRTAVYIPKQYLQPVIKEELPIDEEWLTAQLQIWKNTLPYTPLNSEVRETSLPEMTNMLYNLTYPELDSTTLFNYATQRNVHPAIQELILKHPNTTEETLIVAGLQNLQTI